MNREIKFRAWIKKGCESKMGEVTSINLDEDFINYIVCNEQNEIEIIGLAYLDEYILLQYTGIKDINGKEIYEGDIVKISISEGYREYYGQVEYTAKIERRISEFSLPPLNISLSDESIAEIEVIGNIYENPELLEV